MATQYYLRLPSRDPLIRTADINATDGFVVSGADDDYT
jgi:hypothetical protein